MKHQPKWYLGMLLGPIIALGLSGCSSDSEEVLEIDASGSSILLDAMRNELETLPPGELVPVEEEGLLYMREEEKLARDVYLYLHEVWGQRVFENISQSEQTHMDAILLLIERYRLNDPVSTNGLGVFINDDLQTLYDDLIRQGNASLIEALQVGALIEEVDLIDIERYIADVEANEDIILVYENLMKGSRNHLRAFVRNLEAQGIEYIPQYLDSAEYEAIIDTPIEH
jgi:hypothetical protein